LISVLMIIPTIAAVGVFLFRRNQKISKN
jgi:hypothetical protein